MDIAVTGGNGRLGKVLIDLLLQHGHAVRSLDWTKSAQPYPSGLPVQPIQIDLNDLKALTRAVEGCWAVIHLAAILNPEDVDTGVLYKNNTIASFNVLQAAATLGIDKVCLASSINALGGARSRRGRYDYFPVDEKHPTYNEDDYALSKWVLEQQADSFARRKPQMTISSLRFHALPSEPPELSHTLDTSENGVARTLWGWTLINEAARACEKAILAGYHGHEVFYITAQNTSSAIPSLELARFAYPKVPIRGDLSGNRSFFNCEKAARLLGWRHGTYH